MSAWFRRPWHRSENWLARPLIGGAGRRPDCCQIFFKGIKKRALEPAFRFAYCKSVFAITAQLELLAADAGVLELAEQAIEAIFR